MMAFLEHTAMTRRTNLWERIGAGVFVAIVAATPVTARGSDGGHPAADVVRAAIRARVGQADADVDVLAIDAAQPVTGLFRSARLDPAATLGKPLRVTLTPVSGRPVIAAVHLRVVAEHVIAARDLNRGETLAEGDVVIRRDDVRGVPLRRLPTPAEVIGGRTLRAVPSGAVLLPGAVALRRLVEPGDEVMVVARAGTAEVSAVMVASDGGAVGDVIRLHHPDSRRQVRGRVQESGRVEVLHVR